MNDRKVQIPSTVEVVKVSDTRMKKITIVED